MGDVSIIARRLSDGHVQYGWSGNGGCYKFTGAKLLAWYQDPKDVEYLFELGQTKMIGQVGSEYGGYSFFETHSLTGKPFWLGNTEQMIYSKIDFIDYAYFYDLDHTWYYIFPNPFSVKVPLELIFNNIDDRGEEFDYWEKLQVKIVNYIFNEYTMIDSEFVSFLEEKGYDSEKIISDTCQEDAWALYELSDKYKAIYEYFDDWILIKANSDYTEMKEIVMHRNNNNHIETYLW